MNLAQLYDPVSKRLTPERAEQHDAPSPPGHVSRPPVVTNHHRVFAREIGPRSESMKKPRKPRKLHDGLRELIETLATFRQRDRRGGWADFGRIKRLLPRVDRAALKMRVWHARERGFVEAREVGKRFEYRWTGAAA